MLPLCGLNEHGASSYNSCNLHGYHHTAGYDPFMKVNLHYAVRFRALCGAKLVTLPPTFRRNESRVLQRGGRVGWHQMQGSIVPDVTERGRASERERESEMKERERESEMKERERERDRERGREAGSLGCRVEGAGLGLRRQATSSTAIWESFSRLLTPLPQTPIQKAPSVMGATSLRRQTAYEDYLCSH